MNPKIISLLSEASDIKKKLQSKITERSAVKTSLESVERSEAADRKELDTLLSQGNFDSHSHVKAVAELNAKILLYPARRAQIEGDLASREKAFDTYVAAAADVLTRFMLECRAAIEARIAATLKQFISEQTRIDSLAQNAAQFADITNQTRNLPAPYSMSARQEARGDFMGLAHSAIITLDQLPGIVAGQVASNVVVANPVKG